ncbi:LysR family transcriptional regulator [Actibacterium mucosum KCTC 23349]|uniref:LysR family transcriptional regulator n=1 Tax=Actibacterium mucosum KCTC 23349 TaxID=1454373 RepID=A0A037ZPI5_9RHOB|nr:LysR substrate-binding domain-containing protein [Actibacterium mucosum]KAJ56746.1 LysR family transcriptional regulator [Actibacterium mucosum KCTC 23349]
MNITLRQLTYFTALARTGHFGRAAAECHVSQPALSTQIKELEVELGTRLVERQPRRAVLTPAGHDLLRHAETVLADMRALETQARRAQGLSGRLTLGVIPTIAPYLLPVALPLLRARNVTLDLRVHEATTERLVRALEEGHLDTAILATPVPGDAMTSLPIADDRFLLAGTADAVARVGEAVKPRDLDPNRLLLLDDGHCLADQALDVCAMRRPQTRVDMAASSLGTLCGLVAEGFGVTLLPELAIPREVAGNPKLALRRFSGEEPGRGIALVCRHRTADDPWVGDLAALLQTATDQLLQQTRDRF